MTRKDQIMTKHFLRIAAFALMAILCSTVVVQATTSEQLAATRTVAALA